ncbi:MAG: hypothetical protein ACRENE_10120 [Polyangiaceae bacterium]
MDSGDAASSDDATSEGAAESSIEAGGDVATEGSSVADSSADGEAGAQGGGFTDPKSWSIFDLSVLMTDAGGSGYHGSTFDGRYLYFAPEWGGLALQYDTRSPFTVASSWQTYDISTTVTRNLGVEWAGMGYDGRYAYFSPVANGGPFGLVVRYDTTKPFAQGSSWSSFDMTTVDSSAEGFAGVVSDGRFLYFVPGVSGGGKPYSFARYETQAPFTALTSWQIFDASLFVSTGGGLVAGAFDGRFIYAAKTGPIVGAPVAVRYDTQAAFTSSASWSAFTPQSGFAPNGLGYSGLVFDGKYVYLVPNNVTGTVLQYATTGAFTDVASWTKFATSTANAGTAVSMGGAYDGRYAYFNPWTTRTVPTSRTPTGCWFGTIRCPRFQPPARGPSLTSRRSTRTQRP